MDIKKVGKPAAQSLGGLHLGELVRDFIKNSQTLNYEIVAEKLDMTSSGLRNKMKLPTYGTMFDLIQVSEICSFNFLEYGNMYLRAKGVTGKVYSESEYNSLASENANLKTAVAQLQTECTRLKETIDTLNSLVKK